MAEPAKQIIARITFVKPDGTETTPIDLVNWEMTNQITERETCGMIERLQSGLMTISGTVVGPKPYA